MKYSIFLPILVLLTGFSNNDIIALFEAPTIEKRMVKVSDKLYANAYETTNKEYKAYLESLDTNSEDYEPSQLRNYLWEEITHLGDLFVKHYFDHPGFLEFPVVNVAHEGAIGFCEWLTTQYNSDPKRKFNRVVFRLPTEEEWLLAARDNEHHIFPWGTPYLRDAEGWFLANFRRIGDAHIKGEWGSNQLQLTHKNKYNSGNGATAKVSEFKPNKKGIYNISGNVAEMLITIGRTKGGSWGSTGYYLRLDAEDEYIGVKNGSPFIGFRYFMEVIEE